MVKHQNVIVCHTTDQDSPTGKATSQPHVNCLSRSLSHDLGFAFCKFDCFKLASNVIEGSKTLTFPLPSHSNATEPEMRSPRAKLLWDKWRHVWMMAWDRQKRLHDHLMYLQELERVRQFSWDDWRKRVSPSMFICLQLRIKNSIKSFHLIVNYCA